MRTRLLSAAILGPLGLLGLWWGGAAWAGLIGLAGAGLLLEWHRLSRRMHGALAWRAGVGGGLGIVAAALALVWLRADPAAGRADVLFVVLVVWASDSGAYLAGRTFGGRLLAPRLSPAKTVAGALGGLAAAAAAGIAVAVGGAGGTPGAAAVVALLLGAGAQAGDLLESAAKRAAGVKDLGWLIPGHGGLLDRLDGMLAASLIAALLAARAGRGVVFW